MNKQKWSLYGYGLIGREVARQISLPHVSDRLGLESEPEFIVRSDGAYGPDGKKLNQKELTTPKVGFVAIPSSGDGSLAKNYISQILDNGGRVVTAEKAALSGFFSELKDKSDNFKRFGINASVGGGTRMMEVAKTYTRDLSNITQIHLVVNGTLTSIMSSIGPTSGSGVPLGQAVEQAIALGFAEPGADTPADVIAAEAAGDLPKKSSIFINVLGLTKKIVSWQDMSFEITEKDLHVIEEEAITRRAIVSLYNLDYSSVGPESGIIGGFDKTIENWRVVAGFRNTMRNPLFTSLGRLTGAGNGLVIGLGPNESDGVIKLEGQGAGAKPTVNTMLDDYLKIREFEQ
ncbi:hypothetical protein KBC31_03555 [Candidatus Saccharibacteria bacterium]|jgi:homoserine dehydrogenase|nr:hypothetical protein [Candidatus Saccharibacteria bacterium]